jgi:hypothetical protein
MGNSVDTYLAVIKITYSCSVTIPMSPWMESFPGSKVTVGWWLCNSDVAYYQPHSSHIYNYLSHKINSSRPADDSVTRSTPPTCAATTSRSNNNLNPHLPPVKALYTQLKCSWIAQLIQYTIYLSAHHAVAIRVPHLAQQLAPDMPRRLRTSGKAHRLRMHRHISIQREFLRLAKAATSAGL